MFDESAASGGWVVGCVAEVCAYPPHTVFYQQLSQSTGAALWLTQLEGTACTLDTQTRHRMASVRHSCTEMPLFMGDWKAVY